MSYVETCDKHGQYHAKHIVWEDAEAECARLRKVVDIFNEHRRLAHSLKRDNPQLFEFFEAVGGGDGS